MKSNPNDRVSMVMSALVIGMKYHSHRSTHFFDLEVRLLQHLWQVAPLHRPLGHQQFLHPVMTELVAPCISTPLTHVHIADPVRVELPDLPDAIVPDVVLACMLSGLLKLRVLRSNQLALLRWLMPASHSWVSSV